MKKWFGFGAVFIVCYLIFLIATAPASLVLNQVKLPKDVMVQGLSGSIWHAKAQKMYVQNTVIENVNAELDVISLLSFSPSVDVTFGDAMLPGPEGAMAVSFVSGNLHINDANVLLPANMIAQQLPLPIPMAAQGVVELDIPSYEQGKPLCQSLTGSVNWQRAKINAMEQSIALGQIGGDLRCDKGAIVLEIKPDNTLGLSYNAFIGANFKVSGNGYLTPGNEFPEQLKGVLPFIGSPDRQGRYRLRL